MDAVTAPHLEWVFSPAEVRISDAVVGRGAFGEVRIAKWRNINVACKRLHVFTGGDDESRGVSADTVSAEFAREMHLLSKLRHPNLVLFLGVVVKEPASSSHQGEYTTSALSALQPQMILTELMTCSLYDVLETYHIQLTLPEILDIANDVICGLEYLHEHSPCIVHRDISSKNILIGGNKAKIADLGQAKLFESSVQSRQTGMPGAMAYAAPEVLTGKYSEKLDIFSFGVLLIQMCTGIYPRIDKRDEQLNNATDKYPVFASLIQRCCFYIPAERPSARSITTEVYDIMSNDRHYPPQRRVAPQSDISVLGRRWMESHLEQSVQETQLKLEQNIKLLSVESSRWQTEYNRAVKAETELAALHERYLNSEITITDRLSDIASLNETIGALNASISDLASHKSKLEKDCSHLHEAIQNNRVEVAMKDDLLNTTMVDVVNLQDHVSQLQFTLQNTQDQVNELQEQVQIQQLTLTETQQRNDEVEENLLLTIHRWKQEQDTTRKLQENVKKMSAVNGKLQESNTKHEQEIELLNSRLGQYISLPLPDEIRLRFQDMEVDISEANKLIRNLTDSKHELEYQKSLGDVRIEELESKLKESHEENMGFKKQVEAFTALKQDLDLELNMLKSEIVIVQSNLESNKSEKERLASTEVELRKKIEELETQAVVEAKRTQMLVAKAAAGAAELGLTPEVYEREQAKLRKHHHPHREDDGAGVGHSHDAESDIEGAGESKDVDVSANIDLDEEEYQEQDALARRQVRGTEDKEGPNGLITLLKQNPLVNFLTIMCVSFSSVVIVEFMYLLASIKGSQGSRSQRGCLPYCLLGPVSRRCINQRDSNI
jgi:serine/threonine protein kinase